MKTEVWNNHQIRFIKKDDEWWAVLKDVCDALALKTYYVKDRLGKECIAKTVICDLGLNNNTSRARKTQEMFIVNEFGIYDTVFQSRKKEAVEFRHWMYAMLKQLRIATGLEGFEIFRTLDKEHQKEMMKSLCSGLDNPKRIDFIKCNTIANKAVSTKHGCETMLKKGDMTANMLMDREKVLEDTVELMQTNEKFGLGISVSESIYNKYQN